LAVALTILTRQFCQVEITKKTNVSPNRFSLPATDDTKEISTTMPLIDLKDDTDELASH